MDVTVSNTFTELWEFKKYLELGEAFGYDVRVISCTGSYGNCHNVPAETLIKMKNRWENFDGEEFI